MTDGWQDGLDEWQQGSWREILAANHVDPGQHEEVGHGARYDS